MAQVRTATQLFSAKSQNRAASFSPATARQPPRLVSARWPCCKDQLRCQPGRLEGHDSSAPPARELFAPRSVSGNQVAEEDDSTCVLQFFEELDKAGAKPLLCGANSATSSAGCEALLATRTGCGTPALAKVKLNFVDDPARPHRSPFMYCDATSYPTP